MICDVDCGKRIPIGGDKIPDELVKWNFFMIKQALRMLGKAGRKCYHRSVRFGHIIMKWDAILTTIDNYYIP